MLGYLVLVDRPLRHFPPGTVFEFTARTVQSRFLLRPSESTNENIVGVVGRALKKYPAVSLHAFVALSNHIQGLVSSTDGASLSAFMGYLKGNIARKVGRKVRWREKFWGRRPRLIPILDAESEVARLKYILSQSVQERLVPHPELWPGVHCVRALAHGEPLRGAWFDGTKAYYARRAGEEPGPRDFATPVEFRFSPLPCWADLSEEDRQHAVQALVDELVAENDLPGRSWLGVQEILNQDPHDFPRHTEKSPAPVCHASTLARWQAYKDFYKELVATYERISSLFRRGMAALEEFPAHCFPPAHPWRSCGPIFEFRYDESSPPLPA